MRAHIATYLLWDDLINIQIFHKKKENRIICGHGKPVANMYREMFKKLARVNHDISGYANFN
jgi:hypothetical protein